jgi:membrane-bound serine protease (ClpP class)
LVTGLLFVVGLIALYVELSAPGISVGGLISGLCFALFFWSRFLGGTAELLEVILFLAGVAFLAVELFVIPGFGVAGITGGMLMLIGVLMASQHFVIPNTGRQLEVFTSSLLVVTTSATAFLLVAAVLSRYFGALPIINRLVLRPSPDAGVAAETKPPGDKTGSPPASGIPGVNVGDWGVAQSPLRPAGKVRFGDVFLDVITDGSYVDRGGQVRIVEVQGNRVVVSSVDQQTA